MIEPDVIAQLKRKFSRGTDWAYFFSKLTSAVWARPLFDNGLFGAPPALERDGDYVQMPAWPPSIYLARVASHAPDTIARIVAEIPETDNPRIHHDLLEALRPAPPEFVLPLLPRIKAWLRPGFALTLVLSPGSNLIVSLAQKGEVSAALDLLVDWLSPEKDTARRGLMQTATTWEFSKVLDDVVAPLAEIDSERTLGALMDIYDQYLRVETGSDPFQDPHDGSYMWRTAIEESDQNWDQSPKDALANAIRDTARRAAEGGCQHLADIVSHLRSGKWLLFERVALNLAREVGADCPEVVASLLTDGDLFDETEVFHEYFALARHRGSELPSQAQAELLDWISVGPDREQVREQLSRFEQATATDEQVDRAIGSWKARRLAHLKDWLPADRIAEWEQLEPSAPEHPEFLSWHTAVVTGPMPPLAPEEIVAMEWDEIMSFLEEWRAEEGFMLPSKEGLGRALARAVSQAPERFLLGAGDFVGKDPTYVRGVIDGLRQLLGDPSQGHPTVDEWHSFFKLAKWLAAQPIGESSADVFDQDVSWQNSRSQLAHVLESAIGTGQLPVELSDTAWQVVVTLLDDPQPTPEFESEHLGGMDPGTVAINTVRGTAMHAAFQFLLWRSRREGEVAGRDESVLGAIARHLDPDADPSIAVRSVFGWWFPALAQECFDWATANVTAIFPLDSANRHLFEAAWGSYLARWQPSQRELALLRPQYDLALELLGAEGHVGRPSGSLSNVDQLLSQHLAWFFCTGSLSYDDSLLDKFFERATDRLRPSATEFLGRRFMRTTNWVGADDVLERLKEWWVQRKEWCFANNNLSELSKFGWWVGLASVNPVWYLETLQEVLRTGESLEGDHFVFEALATLAAEHPDEALSCLVLLEQRLEPWALLGNRAAIVTILRSALDAGDQSLSVRVRQFVDLVAAKGRAEFGEVLEVAGSN